MRSLIRFIRIYNIAAKLNKEIKKTHVVPVLIWGKEVIGFFIKFLYLHLTIRTKSSYEDLINFH